METQEYEVTMLVTGRFRVRIRAGSPEEAERKAEYACQEADFGALEDIDWETRRIEDEKGKECPVG